MADRRRRRKLATDDDSEAGSDESEDEQTGQRKSVAGSDGGDSEYESADEEELGEEEEEDDDELIILPDGVVLGEDNKQLDDDEDRKNPQYIPKKGTFYEHDDRTAAEDDVEKAPEEPVAKKEAGKKKVWKEDDKWNHDKFNEFDQAPKSREELIAIYGYDIRNEEGPPRARRRRRYGRGPNKYTRNWEDLDAYAKPVRGGGLRGGLGRSGSRSLAGSRKTLENEEFPALSSPQHYKKQEANEPNVEHKQESQSPRQERMNQENLHIGDNENHKPHQVPPPPPPHQQQQQQLQQHHHQQHFQHRNSGISPQPQDVRSEGLVGRGRGGRGRGRGAGRGYNRDPHSRYTDERGGNYQDSRSSGRGNRGGQQQRIPQQHVPHSPKDVEDITSELKYITISSQNKEEMMRNKNRGMGGNADNRRNTVPPRLQDSAAAAANAQGRGGRGGNASPGGDGSSSRPKRYSSQRQRSIPEQQVPPFPQQHGYIDPVDTGYQGGVNDGGIVTPTSHTVTPPHTQLPIAGGAPPSFVPPAFTTSSPTYPPEPFLGQPPAPRMFPPVTQAPHLFGPPPVAPPVAGPPPPVAGPLGAPPVGAPPGPPVTGPPFLPPENMINYGAHPGPLPGAAPHPPQYPPFQGYTPGVSQPGEIYSNGVTYYNTESQQHLPRSNPPLQKRPKAAIPILPPPERQKKKEGGVLIQDETEAERELVSSPTDDEPPLQGDLKDERPLSVDSSDNDNEGRPEPPSYQEMSEPPSYQEMPETSSCQEMPEPPSYQENPEPPSCQEPPSYQMPELPPYKEMPEPPSCQEPPSYQMPELPPYKERPEPPSYKEMPEPPSYQEMPEPPSYKEMPEQEQKEPLETDTSTNDTHLEQETSKDATLDVDTNAVDSSESDTLPIKEPMPTVDPQPTEQDKCSEVTSSDQVPETPSAAVTVS